MATKTINMASHDELLTTLNGIKFTNREIDIITLIFHTRGSSKIACFLSISTRTVETHTANIMRKIDTNSREGIIDFVEKSGHVSWINKHYRNISIQIDFKKKLQEISRRISNQSFVCSLIFEPEHEEDNRFASTLKDHFNLLGIVVISSSDNLTPVDPRKHHENILPINHTLYVVPQKEMNKREADKDESLPDISDLTRKNESPINTTFLLNNTKNTNIPENFGEHGFFITFTNQEDYCISFFKLLKRMLPEVVSDDMIADFKNKYDADYTCSKTTRPPFKLSLGNLKHKGFVFKHKTGFLVVVSVLILTSVMGLLIVKDNKFNPNNQNETKLTNPIRSDLIIPKGNTFLDRPHITNKIAKSLKDNQGIQTVALVGIGGAGKTTLARNYALQQNANIVWEINAATRESLRDSLEHLAYALCKSEEEKTILVGLQRIKNNLEKDQKILLFIKERMKKISNWFLIYDNVEKFADIHKFFPCDPKVWGNGKIIITSNNSHTKNNSFINSFVQVGELSPQEKLDLFMKIMDEENFQRFTLAQKEKTNTFLNDVPPYPLDISIAAYYLKSTNTPYEQYLERLKENRKDFDTIQADVLKEASGYTKTRYGIITLSIKELMTIHKDFQDLLLLISLIGYQNIPKSLLIQCKGNTIADNFIYHLKKYSLVTNESFFDSIPTISIHRKTQEIILSFLLSTLTLSSRSPLLNSVTTTVEDYILDAVDKEDFSRMKLLAPHGEILLNRDDLLSNTTKSSLKGALGCIYYYLRHYPKIKQYLEENIEDLKQHYGEKHDKIARILFYLGNLHRSFGDYERAKILLEQSLAICKENPNYLRSAKALGYLGAVYRDLGDYRKARVFFEKSLVIYEQHSPESIGHAWILAYLGNIYKILGDYEKAKAFLEQSLDIYKKQSEDYVGTAWVMGYLGTLHRLLGDSKIAKDFIEKALLITKKYFPEDHIFVISHVSALATVYLDIGDYQTAKTLLKNSLPIYQENYGQNHIETANVLRTLGETYSLEGDLEEAEELINKSLLICQQKNNPASFYSFESLADLYLKKAAQARNEGNVKQEQNHKNRAIYYLKQSLHIIKDYFEEGSPHATKIRLKLGSLTNQVKP